MKNTIALVLPLLAATISTSTNDPRAVALVDRAINRMGGDSLLRSVQRVRYEMMTQWARLNYDARPYQDLGSFERHTDVRDYSIGGWRNTRTSVGAGPGTPFIDVVRDSVGGRVFREAWTPLNVAYIDERNELFTLTPDRLVLLARAAPDLKRGADTLIGGLRHARVTATLNHAPAAIFFRHADGLPALFRFRAAHENDFGLAPWGEMDVEVWYSRWATLPNQMSVPMQWDVRRVGKTYKRITVLGASINPTFTADSFAIPEATRTAFLGTQRRPMHDLPYDSAKIAQESFATFGVFTGLNGAVKIGGRWVLLEAGQAPLNAQRADEWLRTNAGGPAAAALVGNVGQGNGGIAWLVRQKLPTYVAPLAAPIAGMVLRNRGLRDTGYVPVNAGRWVRIGTDSLWLEPIDLPNARGTMFAYSPTLKWLWSPLAAAPVDIAVLLDQVRTRKWPIEQMGSLRGLTLPVPKEGR